ncbi:MAG: type III pantothenate kinase [Oscillospiraceae bacterium]|nr:type III pantothenate kinase [Candidatus Ruminococcus equi]
MLLTIDVGNTNIKLGIFDRENLIHEFRFSTVVKTADEYSFELFSLFNMINLDIKEITGCAISSVVPAVTHRLSKAIAGLLNIEPLVVGPGVKTGLNITIDDPSTLGSDLVAGCVAMSKLYSTPCIFISMGTATVLSVLDKNSNMCGCIISPGVRISLNALTSSGALLSSVAMTPPEHAIGKNTGDSIKSGIVLGNACMIDGLIEKIEEQLGEPCSVVASGGYAETVIKICSHKIDIKDDLIMHGLRIIYEKNT